MNYVAKAIGVILLVIGVLSLITGVANILTMMDHHTEFSDAVIDFWLVLWALNATVAASTAMMIGVAQIVIGLVVAGIGSIAVIAARRQ